MLTGRHIARPRLPIPRSAQSGEVHHQRLGCCAECHKAEPLVERRGILINRVNDDCAYGYLLRCVDHAHERVVEQGRADPLALLADVNS